MAPMGSRSFKDLPPASVTWVRRFFRFSTAAAIGVSLAVACSSNSPSNVGNGSSSNGNGSNSGGSNNNSNNSNNNSNNTSGGSFMTTTLSDGATVTTETFPDGATMVVSSSSSSGNNGGTSSDASSEDSGDGGIVCSNMDKSILPIDKTGFIYAQCDVYGIQGAWYCFSDMQAQANGGTEGCVQGQVPYSSTDSNGPGMCLKGSIASQTSAFVGLGLSLNATPGSMAVKSGYTAASSGVIGFAITISGTTGGDGIRVGFTNTAATSNAAGMGYVAPASNQPAASGGSSTYNVLFSSVANVPDYPNIADPDAAINTNGIYDVQVELPGASNKGYTYDFCVTSIQPLFAGDASTQAPGSCSMMDTVGGQTCDPQDIFDGVDYGFQNNITSSTGECIQASQGGNCAGMTVTFPSNNFGSGGNTPSSYPSIIYGWQNGNFYGAMQTGKLLSTITSAPANWSYSVPGGTYDAAWDIWFGTTPTGTSPTLELMVWNGYNGVQPAGSNTGKTFSYNGNMYEVWTGQVNTWKYIAYRNTTPQATGNLMNFDLNKFFVDAEGEGVGLSSGNYLWGIQAGYEIYSATATYTTSSYSVTLN